MDNIENVNAADAADVVDAADAADVVDAANAAEPSEQLLTLRKKANKLPMLPGVYIMQDSAGEVIYVGKAKLLKNRVSSYFRGEHEPKTEAMVSKAADFNVIVAASEFEALMLENSLIKRHKPHYNILLRDDKAYPFIRLDVKSEYPKFTIVSKVNQDGAKYYGPFGGRTLSRQAIDAVSKALGLPTCGKKFPRDIGKERPCLNYHMGTCKGYCQPGSSAEDYAKSVKEAQMMLEGKTSQLVHELTQQMEDASVNLRFEQAAEYRDRLKAVASLQKRQRVIFSAFADMDAVGFYRSAKCCFSVLHYTEGKLSDKDFELMDEPMESDSEALSALLRQYYTQRGAWPKTILLPFEIEDMEPLSQMLSEEASHRVYIEVPKRGDRLRLSEAAQVNAREECIRATTSYQRKLKTLQWLQNTLELEKLPERIEAFDVSNTGSFGVVAAMTVFYRAKPLKKDYRRFKIKDVSGQDDYHSMQEAARRRFARYLDGDTKFDTLPDLLLIDGGQTHAQAARAVIGELGIELPVYGMVKDDKHRTRALMSPEGDEIGLTGNPAVFALIGTIQEETHRFAIEYHRSLRTKTIGSSLDNIKGIGSQRRNKLLGHFKTMAAIKNADVAALSEVVPKSAALEIYDYFHKGEG